MIYEVFKKHLLNNPICEMRYPYPCSNKAVRICRWGTIRSACQECADKELKSFHDEVERSIRWEEENGY